MTHNSLQKKVDFANVAFVIGDSHGVLTVIPSLTAFLKQIMKETVCNTNRCLLSSIIIIIMYIYHALINALSTHMIQINLNMIFCTHVKHSPTKTIYIKHYLK